jgi:hypothetical protein
LNALGAVDAAIESNTSLGRNRASGCIEALVEQFSPFAFYLNGWDIKDSPSLLMSTEFKNLQVNCRKFPGYPVHRLCPIFLPHKLIDPHHVDLLENKIK